MAENAGNQTRALAELVTVEAWHHAFSEATPIVDLHIDVVFGTARLGGEPTSPVRFRLSLKQAEVIVRIPASEPLTVDPRTVSRDSPSVAGRMIEVRENARERKSEAGILGRFGLRGFGFKASAGASGKSTSSSSRKLEAEGDVRLILVTQARTSEGDYLWRLTSPLDGTLEGRPWEASKEPRLSLIDNRKNKSRGIPPTVHVELRCRREDFQIDDLELKDSAQWKEVKAKSGFRNRYAAAEAYIRNKIEEEGLDAGDLSELFSKVKIASATPTEI